METPNSELRTPNSIRGQASLEMTVALVGALVLLFGGLKVFLWATERMVARQVAYEQSRVAAGSAPQVGVAFVPWTEPTEPLKIFTNDP